MTHRRVGIALVLLASLVATAVLTIAASASRSPAATIVGQGKASPRKSVCGLGTGKKATGKPVNIGAIVTVVPGLNWDEITDNAAAYYKCVNDNGGLNGRPINFIVHVEQINPEQVAAFAKKLIEEEKVVALAGTIDALDCAVNAQVLRREEVLRDRRRRPRHLLRRDAVPRSDQLRPGLQHARSGPVPRPQGRQGNRRRRLAARGRRCRHLEQARDRIPQVKGHQGHRRPRPVPLPGPAAGTEVRAAGGQGRRGHPRLHDVGDAQGDQGRRGSRDRERRALGRLDPVERHDLRQGGREVLERQVRRQRGADPPPGERARTRRSTAPSTTSTSTSGASRASVSSDSSTRGSRPRPC